MNEYWRADMEQTDRSGTVDRRRVAAAPPGIRRAVAMAVLVAALTLSIPFATTGGASADTPSPRAGGTTQHERSGPTPERMVGQLLMGRYVGPSASHQLIGRIRRGEVGGVILYEDNYVSEPAIKREIGRLQNAAQDGGNPPLLVAVDQEGGPVRHLPNGPPRVSEQELGAEGVNQSRKVGGATGDYLGWLGVNVDLAPVLDVPDSAQSFLGSRAFARDSGTVTSHGVAFISGIQQRGVAATAKHFPGLGTARANTDLAAVDVTSSRAELLQRLAPFRAAVKAGVKLIMVSNASYPALDPSRTPAALSPAIIDRLLRREMGFHGVVVTDTMNSPGLRGYAQPELLALRAGVDVLLYNNDEAASAYAYRKLLADVRSGALSRSALGRAYQRVEALKTWLEKSPAH